MSEDPRIAALPDSHGHAKGEHKPFSEERPIPYTARMLFLWFFHACRRGAPRFMMIADHVNYLTFEDPAAVNLVRRALKLAQAGDLYGAAETAGVELGHAQVVSEGLRRGMRCSIGAEVDNDPRSRPDAQNIVDAMRPDGMIRAVHFLPITHPQHGENWMWPFDNEEFKDLFEVVGVERTWELYVAALLEAIEKLPGHIVAHFYAPAKFGAWPDEATLERYEDQILDACAERGLGIEINSRFFYRYFAGDEAALAKYRAVTLRLLRKAKDKGVAVAVGSDAHSPKDQGAAFEELLALLDEADINEIAFPIDGRLARVALRATEEIVRSAGGYAVEKPVPEAPPVVLAGATSAAAVPSNGAAAGEVAPAAAPEFEAAGTSSEAKPRRARRRTPAPHRETVSESPSATETNAAARAERTAKEEPARPLAPRLRSATSSDKDPRTKPTARDAKPTAREAKPTAREAKPTAREAKPTAREAKPTAREAKPTASAGKKTSAKRAGRPAKTKPSPRGSKGPHAGRAKPSAARPKAGAARAKTRPGLAKTKAKRSKTSAGRSKSSPGRARKTAVPAQKTRAKPGGRLAAKGRPAAKKTAPKKSAAKPAAKKKASQARR